MTATTEATESAATKPAKVKLSPEERKARVQDARKQRILDAFEGQSLTVLGTVNGPEKYTDVTGNKGVKGYVLEYAGGDKAGQRITVGPGSLKKAVELGAVDEAAANAVLHPPKPPKADAPADDVPAEA
jgi:hypothetical protein